MELSETLTQKIQNFIANLASVSTGVTLGWTSPNNEKLVTPDQSPVSGIPSTEQLSWIASLVPLGALIGEKLKKKFILQLIKIL